MAKPANQIKVLPAGTRRLASANEINRPKPGQQTYASYRNRSIFTRSSARARLIRDLTVPSSIPN